VLCRPIGGCFCQAAQLARPIQNLVLRKDRAKSLFALAYQSGTFLVRLEGDIQSADFGAEDALDFDEDGDDEFDSSNWFGPMRARAGAAFNRSLICATGGFSVR
jgi:hypothetical protein